MAARRTERFESEVRSSQQRLANGNTLITESDGGRLFEITAAGRGGVGAISTRCAAAKRSELVPDRCRANGSTRRRSTLSSSPAGTRPRAVMTRARLTAMDRGAAGHPQPRAPNRRRSLGDALAKILPAAVMVLAIGFLSFVAGSFLTFTGSFPANHLTDAFRGGPSAARADRPSTTRRYPKDFWQPARTEARGVTIYDPRAPPMAPPSTPPATGSRPLLVAMDGEVVRGWPLPFSAVWDESPRSIAHPQPGPPHLLSRRQRLLPNGDLLALYAPSATRPGVRARPAGRGLASSGSISGRRITTSTSAGRPVYVADAGDPRRKASSDFEHLGPPRIDDFVVLSPDGEELKKVWLSARSPTRPTAAC